MTVYYKMRQILLQNATAILLQNASGFLLQNATILLQNATIITNCDDFITTCDSCYKMRSFLQIASVHWYSVSCMACLIKQRHNASLLFHSFYFHWYTFLYYSYKKASTTNTAVISTNEVLKVRKNDLQI